MEVIGRQDAETYLCKVTHTELEKFQNMYYGNLHKEHVKVGYKLNLGAGHDFASEIKSAFTATQDLIKKNQPVVNAIMNGMRVFNNDQHAYLTDALEGLLMEFVRDDATGLLEGNDAIRAARQALKRAGVE